MRKCVRTRTGILARCRHVPALGLLACLLACPVDLSAQGRVVAQEPVDIVILAASRLNLRIGTTGGTIDRVTFTVTQLPGTGAVAGVSSGANPVPVRASSSPGNATKILTADSSIPLSDGAGHTISFTQISWTGTNRVPSGTFTGLPNQQIYAGTQSITNGTMSFSYANTIYVPSGSYNGRVTYTLSSP
jgi:hypothetical protein